LHGCNLGLEGPVELLNMLQLCCAIAGGCMQALLEMLDLCL